MKEYNDKDITGMSDDEFEEFMVSNSIREPKAITILRATAVVILVALAVIIFLFLVIATVTELLISL